MRDWNYFTFIRLTISNNGFKPTYEGLKLSGYNCIHLSISGFKPTYEGLKLKKDKNTPIVENVLSLPMRDWNKYFLHNLE